MLNFVSEFYECKDVGGVEVWRAEREKCDSDRSHPCWVINHVIKRYSRLTLYLFIILSLIEVSSSVLFVTLWLSLRFSVL